MLQVIAEQNMLDFETFTAALINPQQTGLFTIDITGTDQLGAALTRKYKIQLIDVNEPPELEYSHDDPYFWDEGNSAPFYTTPNIFFTGVDTDSVDQGLLTYRFYKLDNAPLSLELIDCNLDKKEGQKCAKLKRTSAFDYEISKIFEL